MSKEKNAIKIVEKKVIFDTNDFLIKKNMHGKKEICIAYIYLTKRQSIRMNLK